MRKASSSGKEKARILRGLVRLAQLQAFALAIVALAVLVALLITTHRWLHGAHPFSRLYCP